MSGETRRFRLWALAPHAASLTAFGASFAIVSATGDNRSDADLYAGLAGYGFGLFALLVTLVVAFRHPWRRGAAADWLLLLVHAAACGLVSLAGSTWLALHLA